jgi:hypothetical protein
VDLALESVTPRGKNAGRAVRGRAATNLPAFPKNFRIPSGLKVVPDGTIQPVA